jgi:alcohol dehydrogenase, propanol-preferring
LTLKALVLERSMTLGLRSTPLDLRDVPTPVPRDGEILIQVSACGVCHTELDEIEGRLPPPRLPVILGHEIVGRVAGAGKDARRFKPGDRVGVGWIYSACGRCRFCLEGNENLCAEFRATGRDANGGYAEYMAIPEHFAFPVPRAFSDLEAAPLMCAGAIGYRSLVLAGLENGQTLGLAGFGASAHLILKMARHRLPDSKVLVFARSDEERKFALELGASWAGPHEGEPPEKAAAIIDTTPVWRPVVLALGNLERGGRLVVNAIRKEDTDRTSLLELDYAAHLWLEKELKTVANVTRTDIAEFLDLAASIPLRPEVEEFALADANLALVDLKFKRIRGAKVLRIGRETSGQSA